jgi:hypothetical protein
MTPFGALRNDYREERRLMQEVMAHDQNVEKRQMEETTDCHETGEPIGEAVRGRDD